MIIALGESIVLTGVTAANAGLNASAVLALILAFIGTATLWWLYFDATAENSRADIVASAQAGRLARDAYSYLHIPIVAGIVAVAVGDNLLLAHPGRPLSAVGTATALGGPALFLFGESVFRLRMIGSVAPRRLACVAALAITALRLRRRLRVCARRDRDGDARRARSVRAVRARAATSAARDPRLDPRPPPMTRGNGALSWAEPLAASGLSARGAAAVRPSVC